MLEVQKFLNQYGLEELQKQFFIMVTDYPDRVVLNYNQIDSPRFVTLVDECRALILRKGTWEVMARSFDRFYNLGESVDPKHGIDTQRIANHIASSTTQLFRTFNISSAIIEEKLDGSLLSLYWDGKEWCVSTRKLAFAEGTTNLGRTFKEVFMAAAAKTNVITDLKKNIGVLNQDLSGFTFVFELTGPENRVVTPYTEAKITLIGGRSNKEEHDYRELSATELDTLADGWKVARPKLFRVSSYEELLALVKAFPSMDEGVVLKIEDTDFTAWNKRSHWRIKCKNPQYVAIAHMRENGNISPKNVLRLIMSGEYEEYLKYFAEDRKYFDFVQKEYNEVINRIFDICEDCCNIQDQKEFALAILPRVKYQFESGIIFARRKTSGCSSIAYLLEKQGAEKIAKAMNLKQKFIDEFHVVVDDESYSIP